MTSSLWFFHGLFKVDYLHIFNVFRFNCTVAGIEKVEPEHKANRASVAVITPTDRPNSVRNRCIF